MKRFSLNTQILVGCLAGIASGFWLAGANAPPAAQTVL